MSFKVDIVKQFFDAINRNDMEAVSQHFDPNIDRIEPEGHATAGTYHGIPDVQSHIMKGRGTWAEGTCVPEEFFEKGDKVVVYLYAWVRLHGSKEWSGGRFADGFTFSHGLITHYHSFWQRDDALKWAGIEGDNAP